MVLNPKGIWKSLCLFFDGIIGSGLQLAPSGSTVQRIIVPKCPSCPIEKHGVRTMKVAFFGTFYHRARGGYRGHSVVCLWTRIISQNREGWKRNHGEDWNSRNLSKNVEQVRGHSRAPAAAMWSGGRVPRKRTEGIDTPPPSWSNNAAYPGVGLPMQLHPHLVQTAKKSENRNFSKYLHPHVRCIINHNR